VTGAESLQKVNRIFTHSGSYRDIITVEIAERYRPPSSAMPAARPQRYLFSILIFDEEHPLF
jgi:hypothetical protein